MPTGALDATSPPARDREAVVLFRAMAVGDNGYPELSDNHLGIRVGVDILPDESGQVLPGIGGMSVTPNDVRDLPHHRLPQDMGGTGKRPAWEIRSDELPQELAYRSDPMNRKHGFVEPAKPMEVDEFRRAIEGTASLWRKVKDA